MAQVFVCSSPGTRFPFRARFINTTASGLVVVSAVTYSAISVTFAVGARGRTAYGAFPYVFDTTAFSWLVMAQSGVAYPVLIKESDLPNATTLLTTWALLAKVADGTVYAVPQA